MCGIAGVVGPLASDRRVLDQMLARILHRGPDGFGQFVDGNVALMHSRLSIIDLSDAAAQPMQDRASGNVLTYNGEIYNYAAVAQDLGPFPEGMSQGDTATLLRAYARWGEDALTRLRGMFAFAIWDARQRKVFLARDRFGMKPLYFRRIGTSLVFASEIRPLLLSDYPHTANEKMLARFLAFRHLDVSNETCFREVHQLPAAHFAWVSLDGTISKPQRYWSPPRFGKRAFDCSGTSTVRDGVIDSVLSHMRSDVGLGVFVSGGIDSSSIACVAASLLGKGELPSFSSILAAAHSNTENRLIPSVLDQLGSEAHKLEITGSEFLDDLPKVFDCHEEPLADASMYAHWRLCQLAAQAGVKVLLSGNGGDEVFGGYGSHVHSCIGSLLGRGRLIAASKAVGCFHRMGQGGVASLWMHGLHESLPMAFKKAIKQWHTSRRLADTAFASLAADVRYYYTADGDPLRHIFLENLEHWCVPPFLHYEDRNGMAFGVEIRTPMLDHNLLETVWEFDPVQLLQGASKHALRIAMRGIVPDAVLDQPGKFGFAAPLDLYLQADKDRFRELFAATVAACPYFDLAAAKSLLEAYYAKRRSVIRAWRVFSVSLWYERFMRKQPGGGLAGAMASGAS